MMGLTGFAVNQVNIISPIIILTLCVCNCIHITASYRLFLSEGQEKNLAIKSSLDVNLFPIFLTTLTTAIGFLSMNFSDSPPFRELGNFTVVGVVAAFILSVTFYPALLTCRQIKTIPNSNGLATFFDKLVNSISTNTNLYLVVCFVSSAFLMSFIFDNELNDDAVKYFDKSLEFRKAVDFTQERLTGIDRISYSLDSGEEQGINDPAFLIKIEKFADWYKSQPEVVHVSSYIDVIKRLNQNMNNGEAEYYRLPTSKELASQYLLLYEMSLPFGLDLNNQINIDKSSLLLTVRVKDQKRQQLIDLDQRAQNWLNDNASSMSTVGASFSMMFAYIGQRNIHGMITGSLLALLLVTVTLVFALRSIKYGLLSLIPNAFPAAIAFGIWGIFVSEVNLVVSVIFAITLGVVVDDTVHFTTKYLKGMRKNNNNPVESVRYAFSNVGKALISTTIALSLGFFVLATSDFAVNSYMGAMVGMTIVLALIWDFLFLPALLMKVDSRAFSTELEKKASGANIAVQEAELIS